jgi:hypothetical protein
VGAAWDAFGNAVGEEVTDAIGQAMDEDGAYDYMVAELAQGFSTIYKASKTYKFTPNLDKLLDYARAQVNRAGTASNKAYHGVLDALIKEVLAFVKMDPQAWGFKNKKDVNSKYRKWQRVRLR